MDPALRRLSLRFRLKRDHAIFILLIGAFIAAVFWIGPDRSASAKLALLARNHDGRYTADVALDSADAVPSRTPGRTVRLPLVLAVRNDGATTERATALYLSIPGYFRLLDREGQRVPSSRAPGSPLVRYRIELEPVEIEPDAKPVALGPADTLWLEPALPDYYCSLIAAGVPEFEAARALRPGSLSPVQVFYAFDVSTSARQTGLLRLTLDRSLVQAEPAPAPPIFRTTYYDTAAPMPPLGRLVKVGERTESCGQPDLPAEVHSVLMETEAGGRVFVLYTGGEPRKYLFDLNRDDVIEQEMWDRDGDGRLDASRAARFRTPSFLLPIPSEAEWLAGLGRPTTDSAWLNKFYNVAAGPFRFSRAPGDSAGPPGDTATDRLATPAPSPPGQAGNAPRTADADTARAAPADRAANTARGDTARTPGQAATRQADTPTPPRRIFGMPVIRQPADTAQPDTARDNTAQPDTTARDTLRRR